MLQTILLICPSSICCKYLKARYKLSCSPQSPLFVNQNGGPLTRVEFISAFKHVLTCIGCNADVYNGHSFNIGAATTATTSVHMEDYIIQVLGGWSSENCCRYIKTPASVLWDANCSLVSQDPAWNKLFSCHHLQAYCQILFSLNVGHT